jgi:hypothetical protein
MASAAAVRGGTARGCLHQAVQAHPQKRLVALRLGGLLCYFPHEVGMRLLLFVGETGRLDFLQVPLHRIGKVGLPRVL